MSDIGADFAATVFLAMTVQVEAATEETAADVFELAEAYPRFAMGHLADGIQRGMTEQGFGNTPNAEDLERIALQAFADRLGELFATPMGGAA